MTDDKTAVTVQILDKEYRIACSTAEQHGLIDAAHLLDQRMRQVRQNGRVIGAERIAVIASLNLVYELQQQSGGDSPVDERRLARLQGRLTDALAGASRGAGESGVDARDESV
ncbi:cell division protein ZapA [Thiohalocapsa marina]|uniref:Cell division protein ZapA n=1 Tax=Thiohalocapsa marina TaxID=424902 RepID=A0A5M8FUD5_9GAMM|nr:cell division protein ZapA [Thiohalocapsa marina]KAA6187438.1 cell division protein ZapA [Thiohalocapsa marina]